MFMPGIYAAEAGNGFFGPAFRAYTCRRQAGYNQNTGTNGWFTKDDWRKQVCVSQKRRKLAEASENVTCAERGVTGRLWTAGDGTG